MYNEHGFIKLIFLLADTQEWLNALTKDAFMQLPVKDKSKLARKTFHLSVKATAHILEKHYYKINRYPQSGKFTIPLTGIIEKVKEAGEQIAEPISGSLNFKRVVTATEVIGFSRNGQSVKEYTVITDAAGNVITAFPGLLRNQHDD